MFTQPSDLREEAKNELLKEVKGLLAMRAMVRKEVLEEVNFNFITIMTIKPHCCNCHLYKSYQVKATMEAKLMMLEKRELAWREEKREALAELDLAKERMKEEVL